jgi:hypothetical protein
MSRVFIFLCLLAGLARAQQPAATPAPTPVEDPGLGARLYQTAGALANEGFKMHDSVWTGRLEAGQPRRLVVNLFGGNHYWFLATAASEARGLKITVFGPDGKSLTTLDSEHDSGAAAGLTAPTTGPYFVQIETRSGTAADFRLAYLYK